MAKDCPHCERSLPSKKALEDHLQRAHPDEDPPTSKTPYIIAGMIAVTAIVVGVALFGGGGGNATGLERFHVEESPHRGDLDAPVALVAFESPACTSCRIFHTERGGQASTFDRIQETYVDTGQLLYVEKYARAGYPWESRGAMGQKCVHEHGGDEAFFDLTQRFYEQQPEIHSGNVDRFVLDFAQRNRLDTDAIRSCLEDGAQNDALQRDLADGSSAGVRGTPTFFLVHADDRVQQLAFGGFGDFANAIDLALAQANADQAQGNDTQASQNETQAAGNETA